jgi:hypothetical protein
MRRYSCVFVVAFVLLAAGWAHAISIDGTTVVVPVVMHGHGAQSTEWRTDLWISNQTPFEKDITVTFYPNSASSSSFTTHIGSWSTIEMDDVVLSQFGLDNSKGLLVLTTDDQSGFSAEARIYNTGNPAGEFGEFEPGLGDSLLSDSSRISGITGVNGNRTNIGIANPNDHAFSCSAVVRDGDDTVIGGGTIQLAAYSVVQVNDIFSAWSIAPQGNVQIRFSCGDGNPIYPYASVVRDGTGDAIFIFGTTPGS